MWFPSSSAYLHTSSLLIWGILSLPGVLAIGKPWQATKPNFVFIITDDQDYKLNSLEYMPKLKKYIGDEGTFYPNHYCKIAVCCPSRISLLTGRMSHNTNVTDVTPPYGGYSKFIEEGLNDKYLPVWLQEAGYNTYYTGKLFNGHNTVNYNNPYPGGWTGHDFLLDPYTYRYWNTSFGHNEEPPKFYPGEYNTDLVRDRSLGLLEEAKNSDKPFFLGIAPIAPHFAFDGKGLDPPEPAPRHSSLFPDAHVPRTSNFNPAEASGVSWISQLIQQNASEVQYGDDWYRLRLQTLQSVDELVEDVINKLQSYGMMENTYIMYTSDNGFHIGQHRMPPGKTGPGVAKGKVVDYVTSHTDIAPTIFQLAGIKLRDEFDGSPMPVRTSDAKQVALSRSNEHVAVEYWGSGVQEGSYAGLGAYGGFFPNSTYKALRLIGDGYNLFYSVWCTNEHELYDMATDPGQLVNLASKEGTLLGRPLRQLQSRLDALVLVLKTCKGDQCRFPWKQLHRKGPRRGLARRQMTLLDALDATYDQYYETLPKVKFSECHLGQLLEAESPMFQGINGSYWPYFI